LRLGEKNARKTNSKGERNSGRLNAWFGNVGDGEKQQMKHGHWLGGVIIRTIRIGTTGTI